MSAVAGKVAVVTGAGSGIGRALAIELVRRGARPAISDIDPDGLAETVRLIAQEASGVAVHHQILDVSDRDAFAAYVETVVAHFGMVHQVYNNAGVASGRTVLDADWQIYEGVIAVNLWGVLHGTKLLLPHLIASGDGHVINISSVNGFMAQSELSAYCTTKFAVRGFTETLRQEMAQGGYPVQVTCVHPGGVRTEIANNGLRRAEQLGIEVTEYERARTKVYNEKLLRMDPARAATIILDGVEAGDPRVLVGTDARLIDWIVRLLPTRYHQVVLFMARLALGRQNAGAG